MLSQMRYERKTAAALLMVIAGASTALADGRYRRPRPDVDIESLRAELQRAGGRWLLEVRYDVEVEDFLPAPGELGLLLFVTERGRVLADRIGRPLEFVVPLDRPSEVDHDEIEFEDRVVVTLSDGTFYDPDDLRLEAVVVRAGDDRPLAHKSERIRFDRPKYRRRYDASGRVSVSLGLAAGRYQRASVYQRCAVQRRAVQRRVARTHRRVAVSRTRRHVSVERARPGVNVGRRRVAVGPGSRSVSGHRVEARRRVARVKPGAGLRHRRPQGVSQRPRQLRHSRPNRERR